MGLLSRRARLQAYEVRVGDLTLKVHTVQPVPDEARAIALHHYEQIESYIARHPSFKTMDLPMPVEPDLSGAVGAMGRAAEMAGVGPLAALSGALAESVGADLQRHSREVLVHCEGSYFAVLERPRRYLVDDATGGGVAVRVREGRYAFHSSHGRSRIEPAVGKAKTVAVLAHDGATASAASAAIPMAMHRSEDIDRGLEAASRLPGVLGAVISSAGRIGVWGDIEITGAGRDGDEG